MLNLYMRDNYSIQNLRVTYVEVTWGFVEFQYPETFAVIFSMALFFFHADNKCRLLFYSVFLLKIDIFFLLIWLCKCLKVKNLIAESTSVM